MGLSLNQIASLAEIFDAVSVAGDCQAALDAQRAAFGQMWFRSFYVGSEAVPFFWFARSGGQLFVFINGTTSQYQAVEQAKAYARADEQAYAPGVNSYQAGVANVVKSVLDRDEGVTSTPIVVFGHSLGGAAAHILGRMLYFSLGERVQVESYSIGCPKWAWSTNQPNAVGSVIEKAFAMDVDPVPHTPPLLLETPELYALTPFLVIRAMLRFWQPVTQSGMTAQGVATGLSGNPWANVLKPASLVDLYRDKEMFGEERHGSRTYARALRAYANRYEGPRPQLIPTGPRTHFPEAPTIQQAAATLATTVPVLQSNYLPTLLHPALDQATTYRVRRRRSKYYVARGDRIIGQVDSKLSAKTIARFGRQLAKATDAKTPEKLATLDFRLVLLYGSKFVTVYI